MIALLLATAAFQSAAPGQPVALGGPCPAPQYRAIGPATGPNARKMTELPPAQHMLAVDKRVGGCAMNVLKQKDLAGNHVMVPAGPAQLRAAPAVKRRRR